MLCDMRLMRTPVVVTSVVVAVVVVVGCQDDPLRAYRKSRDSSQSFSEMGTSFSSGMGGTW